MNRFCINFGVSAGDYYIDNIVLSEKVVETRAVTRASGPTIIEKTDEEKPRLSEMLWKTGFQRWLPIANLMFMHGT